MGINRGHRLHTWIRQIVCGFAVLGAGASHSAVIIEKPLDNLDGGWNSTTGGTQIAEDFVMDSVAVATELTWFGFFLSDPQVGAFEISFFDDTAGLPSSSAFFSTTIGSLTGVDTGLDNNFGASILEWSTNLPSVSLGAGRQWVSITGLARHRILFGLTAPQMAIGQWL